MALDYTTPLFPIREAAAAAGFEVNTLRSLYGRGHFRIIGGEAAKARGLANMLNLRDTMHIAVAKRLMDVGVHPKQAFEVGVSFAHSSYGERLPAMLFDQREHGYTVLIFHPKSGQAQIVATEDGLDFAQLFFDPSTGRRDDAVAILLNDVELSVFRALHPHERTA